MLFGEEGKFSSLARKVFEPLTFGLRTSSGLLPEGVIYWGIKNFYSNDCCDKGRGETKDYPLQYSKIRPS